MSETDSITTPGYGIIPTNTSVTSIISQEPNDIECLVTDEQKYEFHSFEPIGDHTILGSNEECKIRVDDIIDNVSFYAVVSRRNFTGIRVSVVDILNRCKDNKCIDNVQYLYQIKPTNSGPFISFEYEIVSDMGPVIKNKITTHDIGLEQNQMTLIRDYLHINALNSISTELSRIMSNGRVLETRRAKLVDDFAKLIHLINGIK